MCFNNWFCFSVYFCHFSRCLLMCDAEVNFDPHAYSYTILHKTVLFGRTLLKLFLVPWPTLEARHHIGRMGSCLNPISGWCGGERLGFVWGTTDTQCFLRSHIFAGSQMWQLKARLKLFKSLTSFFSMVRQKMVSLGQTAGRRSKNWSIKKYIGDGRSFTLIWACNLFLDRVLHLATFKCTVTVEEGPITAKCFSQKKEK